MDFDMWSGDGDERTAFTNYVGWTPHAHAAQNRLQAAINYEGNKMIRVLIKKEPPFELHVVVNPTDVLNIEKIEAEGHYHVGDYDGEKQIDEAVASVATYLELEESHT
jgi:hypothetical protein